MRWRRSFILGLVLSAAGCGGTEGAIETKPEAESFNLTSETLPSPTAPIISTSVSLPVQATTRKPTAKPTAAIDERTTTAQIVAPTTCQSPKEPCYRNIGDSCGTDAYHHANGQCVAYGPDYVAANDRSAPEFQSSPTAKREAAQLSCKIGEMFGKIGPGSCDP